MEVTELSFEDRTLAAIVGPTGSGKSSILEAISYALYGKTPREQRSVKRLICSRCDAAHVEFRFLVDDREYEITRVLRRSGSGQHIIEDLSSGEKLAGEVAVSNRVIELLGLGFDAFSSSVLLAQGQFAKFLQATPKDRGVILKGIFRLDQIDELQKGAKARREALERDLATIEGESKSIPEDIALILKRAKADEKEASARAAALSKAIPVEKGLLKELSEIERKFDDNVTSLERTRRLVERIPKEADLEKLAADEAESQAIRERAEETLRLAEEAHALSQREHAALEMKMGSETDLIEARAELRAQDNVIKQIEELTAQRDEETKREAAAAKAAGAAEKALSGASQKLRTLQEEHRLLRDTHAAHDLRGRLVSGEPCPVCEQIVQKLPKGKPPSALTKIASEEQAAAKAETAAVAVARTAAIEVGSVHAALEASTKALAALQQQQQRGQQELARFFGSESVSEAEASARLAKMKGARTLVDATREAVTAERTKLDKVTRDARVFEERFLERSQELITLSAQLEVPVPDMERSITALAAHASKLREELHKKMEVLEGVLRGTQSEVSQVKGKLESERTKLGLAPDSLIEAVYPQAHTAAEVAKNDAASAEKQLARQKELNEDERKVKSRQTLFKVLASDLTAQQFIGFLLEERTRLLLELGSERLHTMTGNRYRLELDDNNNLEVVDELDADKRRSVDTLSGGETFLASLALAIALAEVVTRAGGRLQCFFLDEGFGSLDPESFDLAMDGIERIVTPDRLIGLVSHVPALRDRIEDQIILEKGEDGMSRIASGASR
jgi:exonuclease SbcC